jgi:hypothetical protein
MGQVNSHNNPDAVFVDGTGIGWGVHDRLNQLGCPNLVGVDFGAKADGTGIGWGVLDRLNQLGCPNVSSVDFGARPTAPTPATPRCATPTSAPRCGAS